MEHIQFGSTLATVEREYILNTLAHCDGNRTSAAKILHISLRGLRIKLHDYVEAGINVTPPNNGIHGSGQPHHSAGSSAH